MSSDSNPIISVCLCTYKRADKLAQCLQSLRDQTFTHTFEVIVADNDIERSGECVVMQFEKAFEQIGVSLNYLVEPVQNIALARNRSVRHARGDNVAFIDDDERASSGWLRNLHLVMTETASDGVWGPVTPDIPDSFPHWMQKSTLFDRDNPEDHSVMRGHSLRTSNALIKRELLSLRDGPFDLRLGKTGGSDSDLFNWIRLNNESIKFVWSAQAEVIEEIEEKRRHISWHFRRAYRGGWGFSRGLTLRYGKVIGFLFTILRIFASIIKALARAITNLNNTRFAGLIILMNIGANLGKFGYFLGIRLEEYQG